MADEPRQQSQAPSGAPRREGPGGHGGGHGPGGGHGGPRREGGPGGPGGPGGRPRGKRQYFRKKKVCKFCVEKMDFIDYRARARQDSPAPHDRRLLAPPALARRSHQARPQHCANALRRQRRGHTRPAPSSPSRSARRARTSTSAAASLTGSASGGATSSAPGQRSAKNVAAVFRLAPLSSKHETFFKRSTAIAAKTNVVTADVAGELKCSGRLQLASAVN